MASAASVVGLLRVVLTADAAEFQTAMKKASAEAARFTKDLKSVGQQATAIGTSLTAAITVPLVGLAAASAKAAIDFESSFAGVRKTVNATNEEFGVLAQGFRDLAKEIPVNVNELNAIGESAGALGIRKDDILGFTKVMAELGVTTNLTSDQAATSIAQIQNIFNAAGKDTENFASALVALGNDGASTESQIVDFASRLAGAGHQIGLSQQDVLGFSAALANMGLNAELGGTALSKVMSKISVAVDTGGAKLDAFAKAAGMTGDAFKALFKSNPTEAILRFVEGLGKAGVSGENLTIILNDLGLKGSNVQDVLKRLAGGADQMRTAVELSSRAWKDNTALTAEAEKRFETTASQLTLLWNRIKDVGITLGNALLPAIKGLIGGLNLLLPAIEGAGKLFAALPGPIQAIGLALLGIAAAAGPALLAFGQLSTAAASVSAAFAAKGIATRALTAAFGPAAQASTGLSQMLTALGASTTAAAGSTGLFASALGFLTNPITLTIGALGLAGLAIYKVATAETELEKSLRMGSDAFKANTDTIARALDTYQALADKQNLTKEETKQLDSATRTLATASGLSADAFKTEESRSNTLTDALSRQVRARKELYAEAVNQARSAAAEAAQALADAQRQLNDVLSGKGQTADPAMGPGAVPVARGMTAAERVAEAERLNGAIAGLKKTADETAAAFEHMAGVKPLQSTSLDAAESYNQKLEALKQKVAALTEAQRTEIDAALKLRESYATIATSTGVAANVIEAYATGLGKSGSAAKGAAVDLSALRGEIEDLPADELADFAEKLASGAFSVKQLAKEFGVSQEAIKLYKHELSGAAKEHKTAETAAETHRKELEKLDAELAGKGIFTVTNYSTKLGELVEVLNAAAQNGTPALKAAVKALAPEFDALAKAAEASGIAVGLTGDIFNQFAAQAGLASLASKNLSTSLLTFAPTVQSNVGITKEQSAEFSHQAVVAKQLQEAYETLGMKSREELQKTAIEARVAYERIVAAVGEKAPEAVAAHVKMVEAINAATGKIPSYWQKNIFPGIRDVLGHIQTAVSGSFAQMLLGAKGFKDGFLDVWKSLKAGVLNILASIADAFLNSFLKGLLGMMTGQKGAFSQAFAGLFGGAGQGLLGGLLGGGGAAAGGVAVGGSTGGLIGAGGASTTGGLLGAGTTGGGAAAGAGGAAAGGGGAAAGGGLAAGLAGGAAAAGGGALLGLLGKQIFGGAGWQAGAFGAGSGAAAGAVIGSVVPVLGTAIGALVGGLAGLFSGWIGKSQGEKVNDARDQVMTQAAAQFGGTGQSGTGAGSDFAIIGDSLNAATGSNDLFERFLKASTLKDFEAVTKDVAAALDDYKKTTDEAASSQAKLAEQMNAVRAVMRPDEVEALSKAFQQARLDGFAGTEDDFLKQQLDFYQTLQEGDARLKTFFYGETISEFNRVAAAGGDAAAKIRVQFDEQFKAINDQIKGLDDELAKIDASEKPEAHMGTVERQARERIAKQRAFLEEQLKQAREASEAAVKAAVDAQAAAAADAEIRVGKSVDSIGGMFMHLGDVAEDEAARARQALQSIGRNIPAIDLRYRYRQDGPGLPEGADVRGLSTGGLITRYLATGGPVKTVGALAASAMLATSPLYAAHGMFVPKGRDTVPIMAEEGEFMQPVSAVQRHGVPAMEAIQKGKATVVLGAGLMLPPTITLPTPDAARAVAAVAQPGSSASAPTPATRGGAQAMATGGLVGPVSVSAGGLVTGQPAGALTVPPLQTTLEVDTERARRAVETIHKVPPISVGTHVDLTDAFFALGTLQQAAPDVQVGTDVDPSGALQGLGQLPTTAPVSVAFQSVGLEAVLADIARIPRSVDIAVGIGDARSQPPPARNDDRYRVPVPTPRPQDPWLYPAPRPSTGHGGSISTPGVGGIGRSTGVGGTLALLTAIPLPEHDRGGVFSRPHLAAIAEGGQSEIVGSVPFMAKALEGALAKARGAGPMQVTFHITSLDPRGLKEVVHTEVIPMLNEAWRGNYGAARTDGREALGVP